MASVIQICNVALSRLGNSRVIASLTEKSKEAAACSLFYEDCRDAVLADFPWGFAMKRLALAELDITQPDWQFSYRYPTDCMRLEEIYPPDGARYTTPEFRVPFETGAEEDGAGRLILTNLPNAWIRYVSRITDPNMYGPEFRDALSWRIAAEINMQITGDTNKGNEAAQKYQLSISAASALSISEAQEPVAPWSDVTNERLS
ncbi:hypothetical protein NJH77_21325 [Serratia fonticola]|uniref:hypothetical protein n=1 Tax=Serratia fonticola TaxID=47917 RepID=UPI00209695DD|nr:hypothetical protein [Serratia fonticola]MCO7511795.1 hypothetical protein [Serratia fonticola]